MSNIARYTTWDPEVAKAIRMYWIAYDIPNEQGTKVSTLNRVKKFLTDFMNISGPTTKLVKGILNKGNCGKIIWEWVDLTWNICNFVLVHTESLRKTVHDLLERWTLRKEPIIK